MFSSVGWPALVPILMPGGMGRRVAELVEAEERSAAPPSAILAKSLRAGLGGASLFWWDSGWFMVGCPFLLELRANRDLHVGLRGAEVRKVADERR